MSTLAQFEQGWGALALMIVNLINLSVSTYNARRLNHVREEQKAVKYTLENGTAQRSLFRNGNGKEVKL